MFDQKPPTPNIYKLESNFIVAKSAQQTEIDLNEVEYLEKRDFMNDWKILIKLRSNEILTFVYKNDYLRDEAYRKLLFTHLDYTSEQFAKKHAPKKVKSKM